MAYSNSSLALFSHDLLTAVPRFLQNAGAFAFNYMPDQLDNFFAKARSPGSFIASKTTLSNASLSSSASRSGTASSASSATSALWGVYSGAKSAASGTASASGGAAAHNAGLGWFEKAVHALGVHNMNSFDGVFSYFASRWALSTFIIAIVLNRTRVYSASRRRLVLNWQTRLALRIIPILLFVGRLQAVLQMMRCQTGFSLPTNDKASGKGYWNDQFSHEGGALHALSSSLLFMQSEQSSCTASGMYRLSNEEPPFGSASILWPMFLCLCLSQFVETLCCALEGRHPVPETAMTIFEHSLAFAEAEAVVRGSVGLGIFGPLKSHATPEASAAFAGLTRSTILQRLNVPPEVLLIALISSCSHLSNHILGVLGLQSRCRLVNTTIWGTSFIAAFLWSFFRFAQSVNGADIGVLRYPTICIIGFVPHIVILASILVCATIYSISLLVTLVSAPTADFMQTSFRQRLWLAKDNLQASVALSNIHMRWSDEFYTTLLKVGFSILTAASEAVYFNEGISIAIARSTWLENQRVEDLAAVYPFHGQARQVTVPAEIEGALDIAEGLNLVDAVNQNELSNRSISGYARERKTAKLSLHAGTAATREDGVGGSQRSGRWYMSWALLHQDFLLLARLVAKVAVRVLRRLSPHLVSDQLLNFANPIEAEARKKLHSRPKTNPPTPVPFWVLSDGGRLKYPPSSDVDVEEEMRKRFALDTPRRYKTDTGLDDYLYDWWKKGGTWGELDTSGGYTPSVADDEDTTSIITDATDIGSLHDAELGSDDESGQRTPTQSFPSYSRESSSAPENMLSDLSRLLDPQSQDEKQEARLLAARLGKQGALTRSQYARERGIANLQLLAGRAYKFDKNSLTPQEEEELFEKIILGRRNEANNRLRRSGARTQSWSEGGEGLGAGGPQCVVCQSEPRTILVWPCRCLCLCEECRVSLALNNFANCVTCRRDVVAFSRLYVP